MASVRCSGRTQTRTVIRLPLLLAICLHHIDTALSYHVITSSSQVGAQHVKLQSLEQESSQTVGEGAPSVNKTVDDVHRVQKIKANSSLRKKISKEDKASKGFVNEIVERIRAKWTHQAAMPVIFGLGMFAVFLCAIVDFRVRLRADPEKTAHARSDFREYAGSSTDIAKKEARSPTASVVRPEPPKRSLTVVILLTSYRFYTGFLGATWVPFLIAKEGKHLIVGETTVVTTASFMGICKMIYGFSIFLNPFFGLLSDKLAATAPWGGRSAFLLAGVAVAGFGIYAAKNASESSDMMWYLEASCLWMLGEAMADITTETVAPEMLPRSQYDLASAIRSMHHLLGALCGYVALIVAAVGGFSWRWLYECYLVMMLLFALPTIACMRQLQGSRWTPRAGSTHTGPALASLFEAYVAPMRYSGGFPRACLCMCIFSLGTGPIFFTLLMLHDLVGIENAKEQQLHFSCISITFLVGAVITAACSGVSEDPNPGQNGGARRSGRRESNASSEDSSDENKGNPGQNVGARRSGRRESNASSEDSSDENKDADVGAGPAASNAISLSGLRWTLMFFSTVAFGLVIVVMPTVSLPTSSRCRLWCFYIVSAFLGMAFGSVYSRFQACTWSLLPPHVEIANAMGFAAVAKLVGTGFGNFVAGVVLDSFRNGRDENGHNYRSIGYFVMCWCSAACVFISAFLVWTIYRQKTSNRTLSCCFRRWYCPC